MLGKSVWAALLDLQGAVVEDVDVDLEEQVITAFIRPRVRPGPACGRCGQRAPFYDQGEGPRTWRGLDFGVFQVQLIAHAPRVECRVHGPTVRAFPWARHGARHTRAFDQQVAWLATKSSKSAVRDLMRISWRTVGTIVDRVWADTAAGIDPFAGLRRIGIDEISYKRGHKFLTVVVDHDTGRLVWAAPGRDRATLQGFFDALADSSPPSIPPGEDRRALITHVTADGAAYIDTIVAHNCPQAIRCADPFHVVRWATDALDAVRRDSWNTARRATGGSRRNGRAHGKPRIEALGPARELKRARWVLWKNPENLTNRQQAKLDWITKNDPRLYRAYLHKEGLRLIFRLDPAEAPEALDRWLARVARSRIESFIHLGRRIRRHREQILASITHGLSNGRIESVNTKIRLITRIAFGFKTPEALIALAMLSLGGHPPTLPGRK